MGLLKLLSLPHNIIPRMMPIATSCPILPGRSEILLGLLLGACLIVEVIAPVALQIVSAALFVPLAIAIIVCRRPREIDNEVFASSPLSTSLAARAPPVS